MPKAMRPRGAGLADASLINILVGWISIAKHFLLLHKNRVKFTKTAAGGQYDGLRRVNSMSRPENPPQSDRVFPPSYIWTASQSLVSLKTRLNDDYRTCTEFTRMRENNHTGDMENEKRSSARQIRLVWSLAMAILCYNDKT